MDTQKPPLVLPGDEAIRPLGDSITSDSFSRSEKILTPDKRFLLNLIPQPFAGNILTAKVYVLLLNPGFGLLDIFAEEQSKEFRRELVKALSGNRQLWGLNPKYYWTGGFGWISRKIRTLVETIGQERKWSIPKTLEFFSEHIAILELVPYHSSTFSLAKGTMDQLEFVRLIKNFLHEEIVPRARKGDCTIIVTRKSKDWELRTETNNVVIYQPSEARAAHLSMNTRGGKAILSQLRKISS